MKGEWISVKDRLPDYHLTVKCTYTTLGDEEYRVGKGYIIPEEGGNYELIVKKEPYICSLVKWMPLPEAPE